MNTRRKIERKSLKAQAEVGEIEKLKAAAYDLIGFIESAQGRLRAVNQRIAELSGQDKQAPPPPAKEPEAP